jgi:hypothetical protein
MIEVHDRVANYLNNRKRKELIRIEDEHEVEIVDRRKVRCLPRAHDLPCRRYQRARSQFGLMHSGYRIPGRISPELLINGHPVSNASG